MPDPTTESLNYLGSDTDKMFAQVPDVYNEEVVNKETSPITRVVDATEIKKSVPQGLNPDLVAEFYVAVARQEGFKGGVRDYSEVLAKDKGAQLKAFSHAKKNGYTGTQEDLMKATGIQTPVKKKRRWSFKLYFSRGKYGLYFRITYVRFFWGFTTR